MAKRTGSARTWFYVATIIACLGRLILTAKCEIVARPADAVSYANSALSLLNYENVHWHLAHPPGYPLFIAAVKILGIPLRVGHELAYLAAAVFFLFALRKLKIARRLAFCAFCVLLYAPTTFFTFNFAASQSLFVSQMVIFTASIGLVAGSERNRERFFYSLVTGISLGFAAVTRSETYWMNAYFLFIAACIIVWRKRRRLFVQDLLYFAVIPFCAVYLILFSVAGVFRVTKGITGTSLISSREYQNAHNALLRIDTGSTKRFIPIDNQALELACRASPTFATLKPHLDADTKHREHTRKSLGENPDNEFASGWFHCALRQAARRARRGKPQSNLATIFSRIGEELNAAFEEGLLPERKLLGISLLDPRIRVWGPYLPGSIAKVFLAFLFPRKIVRLTEMDDPTVDGELFNQAAGRRVDLLNEDEPQTFIPLFVLNYVYYLINASGLISFILLFAYRHSKVSQLNKLELSTEYRFFISACVFIIIARSLMYAILDAAHMNIFILGYLFPFMPVYSALSLLNVGMLFPQLTGFSSFRVEDTPPGASSGGNRTGRV